MKRAIVTLTLALVATVASAMPAAGTGPIENVRAHLSGAEEVDPVDTSATGQAILRYDARTDTIHYRLIVANIDDVTMAHIHLAPAGQNGPVVAWLYPPDGPPPQLIPGRTQGVLATGTITDADLVGPLAGAPLDDLLAAIRAGGTYVNVHTLAHPAGEIRGQLR